VAQNVPGRHRAPGRFSALSELKIIAKESAQPAVKGAAIVAASGGLVASFAGTANAAEGAPAVAADTAAAATAPAVVGPQGTVSAPTALSSIGFVAKPAAKSTAVKPRVIRDVKVENARKAAQKAKEAEEAEERAAAREAAADRAEAPARASRTSTRTATATRTATRTTTTRTVSDPAPRASGIVGIAKSLFGVPYVYGGRTPNGFDCSGFTSYVYRQAGITIPRTASAQKAAATPVSSPRPGDLVFFGYPVYHVGIYVSPGTMIDAQRPGTTIGYHSIWTKPSGYGRF
jgi:cell wall-associated NlpC family hydrolase